jgi:cobalt-zinc-cadmium efflux system outer membrane protein
LIVFKASARGRFYKPIGSFTMIKLIVPLLLAAVVSAPARAQLLPPLPAASAAQAPPLSLQGAIALALSGNAEIAIARGELAAREGDTLQAAQAPNPSLELLREGTDSQNGASTVQLSVPVELGGKRAARRAVAALDGELGRQVLAITRARVRAETVAAYAGLQLANEQLLLAQSGALLAASSSEAAARRVLAGKISPVEESRTRLAEAAVKIALLQARRDVLLAQQRLLAMLPADAPPFGHVDGGRVALPRLPVLATLFEAAQQAPVLAQARLEVARRAALSQLELSRRTPDLTLLLGARRDNGAGRQLLLGVSLPLPLFDRNQGAVLAAMRRLDKARDEQALAQRKLRLELGEAHARLASALAEVALIEHDIVPGARDAFDAARRGFEAGKFSALEVLDAQRTLLQFSSAHLKAVAEAHRAAADIAIVTAYEDTP